MPSRRRLGLPYGFLTYLTSDLTVKCNSLGEIQTFLRKCRYTSDSDQFGVMDYWMRPGHFERVRRGDCEDFALWTWRQLLAMGIEARFVCGRYGRGYHAWVTFSDSERHYLLEPTAYRRKKLSRLKILLLYKPDVSISFRDGRLVYYEHESRDYRLTPVEILSFAVKVIPLLVFCLPWYLVKNAARRIRRLISEIPPRRSRRRKRIGSFRLRSPP